MQEELLALVPQRKGHFRFESGHHGDVWLDLGALFLRPAALDPFVDALARRIEPHHFDAICGPLLGGAFLAQMIAHRMRKEFFPTERLFTREYEVPRELRALIAGKQIAVVDDAINAAWAIRSTASALVRCGAIPVVFAALLTFAGSAASIAAEWNIPLHAIGRLPGELWAAAQCPLCAAGVPLESNGSCDPCDP